MPNSVLWVCLVAVWLFVLVPMVIKGRPQMRKTTDAVKETRLLHRGGTRTRTTRRRASGSHPHDPSWKADRTKRSTTSARTAVLDRDDTETETDTDATDSEVGRSTRKSTVSRATGAAVKAPTVESDEDVETPAAEVDSDDERDGDSSDEVTAESDADAETYATVDDDDEVTVDGEFVDPEREDVEDELDDVEDAEIATVDEIDDAEDIDDDADLEDEYDDSDDDVEYEEGEYGEYDDDFDDEYDDEVDEYDDDIEDDYEDDFEDEPVAATDERPTKPSVTDRSTPRRQTAQSSDARRTQLRYRERQRVLLGMIILLIAALASGIFLGLTGWFASGVVGVVLLTYLAYLRRTAATEQKIRAQRAARARRAEREQAERRRRQQAVPEFAAAPPPQRLRRPGGATVLELDDEDPVFDHLPPFQRRRMMREDGELRRVAG
ncbi:gephyrin-like molybdotransferase receptor GlpR [Gordonia sp. SL306]|uniref:gephyrin-like molybdotransferase receptor GlpR n=1 Tax=Gordonia sp. SL306 TaxID=2995145 RepID=UPI00226DAED6|nr:gephyrin-like molybdotransferase receptor GlpR [Gordonia sp. SL306]WAC54488.1 hypothetical protein OVA31_17695 [Gordonia sp. SL306]